MKLAILDDEGKIMLALSGGPDLPRLERELTAPLAKRIADKLSRLSTRATWEAVVQEEIRQYFLEVKQLGQFAQSVR